MTAERARRLDAFLARTGWADAAREALPGDASFRRYVRLTGRAGRAMLMDAPSPEDVGPFERVARHLGGLGLSAPGVVAADGANGFLLLEDLGDDTFARALAAGADEAALYALAVDALIALQRHPHATAIDLPRYDFARLVDEEAMLLVDWYLPAVTGAAPAPAVRAEYRQLWRAVLAPILDAPPTLVLRDFHVDNLMRLDREGVAACGLLDFQDAVLGHPAYDLVSLLEDARRDVPPAVVDSCRARYAAAFPWAHDPAFEAACRALGASRHAKVIGIFTRLDRRDGKPAYLAHIPRVWRLLEAALAHPALDALARWFARCAPPAMRRRSAA